MSWKNLNLEEVIEILNSFGGDRVRAAKEMDRKFDCTLKGAYHFLHEHGLDKNENL